MASSCWLTPNNNSSLHFADILLPHILFPVHHFLISTSSMDQKRRKRKAKITQKRSYEDIHTFLLRADPMAVQQVHQEYPESAKTGSTASAATLVVPSASDNVSWNPHTGHPLTTGPYTIAILESMIQNFYRVYGDNFRNILITAISHTLRDPNLTPVGRYGQQTSHPTEMSSHMFGWQTTRAAFSAQETSFPSYHSSSGTQSNAHDQPPYALSMHEWSQQGFSMDSTYEQQLMDHAPTPYFPGDYAASSGYQPTIPYQLATTSYGSVYTQQSGEGEEAFPEHSSNENVGIW